MHLIILTRYSRIYQKIWKWKKILCETVRKVDVSLESLLPVCMSRGEYIWSWLMSSYIVFLSKSLILFLWRFSDASHFTLTFAIPCIFAYVFQWSHTGVWLQVFVSLCDNWENYFFGNFSFDYSNIY